MGFFTYHDEQFTNHDSPITINVSPLAESDIPSILEIEYDSQPEPWTEKAFLEEIYRANSSLLVARLLKGASAGAPCHSGQACPESVESGSCEPGVVAGYICFWSIEGEIQILNIAVRRTLRRKGIARKLIEQAIRMGQKRHAGLVTLEVRKSNLAARKLYECFGFRETGERPNYYVVLKESGAQKESAILMELELS